MLFIECLCIFMAINTNYFSSIPLLELLQSKQIQACGTINFTRKDFPGSFSTKCRGDFNFRATPNGIISYKWKDIKDVLFISNYHGIEETFVDRRNKDEKKWFHDQK